MVKIGIIGCGGMGHRHASCYEVLKEQGAVVTAVADVRPEKAKDLADKFGCAIYENGMDLIQNADVDAVDICLPTFIHACHAIAAMKAGKAVFCEKPVCLTVEEGHELLRVQKETGAKVMVGLCLRMWDEYMWLKQVYDDKRYGELENAVLRRLSPIPGWGWENWLLNQDRAGGVAVDMHIHDVDFIRHMMGEPEQVQASVFRNAEGLIEHIMAAYNYGRKLVTIEANWHYPLGFPFESGFRVKFEKATVVCDFRNAEPLVVYTDNHQEVIKLEPAYAADDQSDENCNITSLGAYYNELRYFVEGLQGLNDLSKAPLDEAVKSLELVYQEIEAAGGFKKV